MPRTNLTEAQKTELAARLEWLEKAYTAVGVFCFTWALAALVGIYTRSPIKIPVFGEVTFTEVVVYTLYAFCLGIPLLLGIVLWHRRLQKATAGTCLFPVPHFSKLPNSGMPASFRTLAFVALVVFPVVAQEITLVALYRDVCIAWKPQKWWKAEDYKVVLSGNNLFTFPPNADGRDYANWRFMRLEEGHVKDLKKRAPNPEDDDGRPATAKEVIPVQLTAFPGYAPWAFRISAHGSAVLVGWLLITRDGSLPRRLIAILGRIRFRARSRTSRRARH